MRDLQSAVSAFEGADMVIDLAANPDAHAPWSAMLSNNIPATVTAFEAARLAGVRRVVYASSNHVTGMYERDEPYASIVTGAYEGVEPQQIDRIRADWPIRPDGPYGVSKALGEAAARYYADEHGLSMICLRIGGVTRDDRPRSPRQFAVMLTHRDLAHLVECCLDAPAAVDFATFYGVSRNTWRIWDIDHPRQLIGYEPLDDAELWR